MNEIEFENELIQYLSTGKITSKRDSSGNYEIHEDPTLSYNFNKKLWKYEPNIKTIDGLWDNFKHILERLNSKSLDRPLSAVEFGQVKQIISGLNTPYEAGQFLYGLNGVSQVEVDLDDGRHVFLTVFDQRQIGAGDTVYQVVNQISNNPKRRGSRAGRFDVTLLINGLPIVQIEEKIEERSVNEALNQIHRYISEGHYRDIFSTLQILVALTPNDVKYMANTTADRFNKDFAFYWQKEGTNEIVRNWKEFADSVLSIPMAHQMATNYMILDGTKNRQTLKVMRPYQVYATQKVIKKLKNIDFDSGDTKVGYIWHTTGSGKTITSFKTAWLASRMPNVDKVVFVVDRIALTKQTSDSYKAYDPDASDDVLGNVMDTFNTSDLSRKLKSKSSNIIVTSVQKLYTLVNRESFKAPDKRIVFVVDEAHRSTGGDSFKTIQKAFKRAAWIGYTGTPMFEEKNKSLRTEDIFGELLHWYTIRNGISDRNVLGFKVDFETTIDEDKMKSEYLPAFYKKEHPEWTEQDIAQKIQNLSPEDMDDMVEPSFYDENEDHVKLVVEDIFKKWRNRSADGKYNALLTTHVGGGKASTPMAIMYFREFQRVNLERKEKGLKTLKVAMTFSYNSSNNDTMVKSNKGLAEAMSVYDEMFNTNFSEGVDVAGYSQDVISRLNRSARDKQFLDLVIVVDQLLTGFDAPELNTLYVDRTLRDATLIQAYSRTNRIADLHDKPHGNIVNYRWPAQSEKLMNEALAKYADPNSANTEGKVPKAPEEVLAKKFIDLLEDVKEVVDELRDLTDFNALPHSEKQKERMVDLMRAYGQGVAKLKQYSVEVVDGEEIGFDYENPDLLIEALGMSVEEEKILTTVLTNELKSYIATRRKVPVYQIELRMSHIKEISVNYDYLTEQLEKLMNAVHVQDKETVSQTETDITNFANGLQDRSFAKKIQNASEAIVNKLYPSTNSNVKYPVKLDGFTETINEANTIHLDRLIQDFRIKWGIVDIISSPQMRELFDNHRYGEKDLDDTGSIRDLIMKAATSYDVLAHDEDIQNLSKIKYRIALRNAIYQFADELAEV